MDSQWIEVDPVTALIGVNESGKTNILLPLWKLNPARDGDIVPISDYPKNLFGEIRAEPEKYSFITAQFNSEDFADEISKLAELKKMDVEIIQVKRFFDGSYQVRFPNFKRETITPWHWLANQLHFTSLSISDAKIFSQEGPLQDQLLDGITDITTEMMTKIKAQESEELTLDHLKTSRNKIIKLIPKRHLKTSKIVGAIRDLLENIESRINQLEGPDPGDISEIKKKVLKSIPKFVYYSNYGNLDSEIYLPHVVENQRRDDLGAKEAAKARTLRVLFDFVKLQAEEILELGQDFQDPEEPHRDPNDDELEEINEKKRTRSTLLQAAGSTLTPRFRDWWKQGEYRFRFEADGNHFRIWVSDDLRPTEVELESRSTGLQWFLSFFMVFLVESLGRHKNTILLLDEPGLSLHPMAQRDLSAFFDNLSKTNPIIYTAHSPFLVDADKIERARKIYVTPEGTTEVTSDLRYSDERSTQPGAAYAVYSALGLSVAESLLLGCQPIIVEGPSDQLYLTAIKSLLVSAGKITPKREIVFPPAGGTKTARVVASIITGRDESVPVVLLDSDAAGKKMKRELSLSLYANNTEKILLINQFAEYDNAEIEDLFPLSLLADEMDRIERTPEIRLVDIIKEGQPFVDQVKLWASHHEVELDKDWKVKLAKRVKERVLTKGLSEIDKNCIDRWVKLFKSFENLETSDP